MRIPFFIPIVVLLMCSLVFAGESTHQKVTIEFSKPMPWRGVLGTMLYQPTAREKTSLKKVTEKPIDFLPHIKRPKENLIPMDKYHLKDQIGEYVGWFGIVRDISWDKEKNTSSLLLEHKYFDGLTDLHLQIVSIYGAGDFIATLPGKVDNVPMLSLVRVYGKASKGKDGLPTITSEYIRLWDWGLFSFMDYGKDRTTPKWLKLRKLSGKRAYSSRPTKKFYEERLGTRKSSNKPDAGDGK